MEQSVSLLIAAPDVPAETVRRLAEKFHTVQAPTADGLTLKLDQTGLSLCCDTQVLRGDFTHMLPRLKPANLSKELLVRAARIKDTDHTLTAIDATAGLGEDSLLLAAAGFHVTLYEWNPVIYELLRDTLDRAAQLPGLCEIVSRMHLICADSMQAMQQVDTSPDVVLLDPMFPQRQKSALVKKKLQMIQKLEIPCADEKQLLLTAMQTKPKKLIVKRPPKGPWLAGIKPDHSVEGKAVRFDCFVSPCDRIHKYM